VRVTRYDTAKGDALTFPAKFNADGSVEARSIITSIGVFPYKLPNGTVRHELRTPEEVFSKVSLDSMATMPIYIGHKYDENKKLIKDEAKRKEMAVGYSSESVIGNNVYVSSDLKVTRADGVEAIKKGMQSLSVGYDCEVIPESGTWCGIHYDAVQKNIVNDHIALCWCGRQGDQAVIHMDSEDAILCDDAAVLAAEDKNSKEEGMAENLKTIQLDSVDYSAEPAVIDALQKAVVRADTLDKELLAANMDKSKIEAERDSLKAKFDSVEKELEDMKKAHLDEAEINTRVAQRIVLVDSAKVAGVEVKGDEADIDLKKAVILKAFPDVKFDGKDDNYINASFDFAVGYLPKVLANQADATVRATSTTVVKTDSAETNKIEASRQEMINRRLKKQKV
jgi:hypothetical protein